ncbi:hypothetical protein Bca4012_093291 [Brassica carinata]
MEGGDKYEALLVVVERIKKELGRLNKVVEKQGSMLRKYKGKTIGKFSSSKLGGLGRRKKSAVSVEPGALFGGSDPDGTDNSMEELGAVKGGETRTQTVAEHGLKEGDGVPLLYTKKGDETDKAHVVLYGSGSNTFYVTEEEKSDAGADLGVPAEVDFGDLNRLVGVITRGVTVTVAEKEVGKGTEAGAATKDTDGQSMEAEGNAMELGDLMEGPNEKSGEASKMEKAKRGNGGKDVFDGSVKENLNVAAIDVKEAKGDGEKGALGDGLVAEKVVENFSIAEQGVASEGEGCDSDGNGDKQVMELSDSSSCQRSEKYKPVEREADLAALLLAKEPFTMEKLVPTVEDTDFCFFENVLHLNAGKDDLDNQFFLDLAASQKWVSTQVLTLEALVEYVANRHEEILKERRSIFLPPWFVAHLQRKASAFNAARGNRGRVLGDGRLSGFLTKEGRKWGAEIDTLYAPMIWDGNHWVGLCISLRDWRVLVLDPNPRLKDMAVVWGLLEVVSKMLPYLVDKVCPPPEDGAYSLEPFTVERMGGAYENCRSGDC